MVHGVSVDDQVCWVAVQTVREEGVAVRSLRALTPQRCGAASVQVMRLHSNISHLRQQVDTAKALLRDMQVRHSPLTTRRSPLTSQTLTTHQSVTQKTHRSDTHHSPLTSHHSMTQKTTQV